VVDSLKTAGPLSSSFGDRSTFAFDGRCRYRRRGPSSEGYIDDSFDYAAVERVVA
jgi:hypothetical protein